MKALCLLGICLLSLVVPALSQLRRDAFWCVVNEEEMLKCTDLVDAIRQRVAEGGQPPKRPYNKLPLLQCVQGTDRFDCMRKISDRDADFMTLDPGMGYTAGDYFTMVPMMAEKYLGGQDGLTYNAVAVVRKDNRDIDFNNLKGKKSCHTGVGRASGWVVPISTLITRKIMPITECNVPVKSAASFFSGMCAPNGLARYYNPFGNNPQTVCSICAGQSPDYCTGNDPYADYEGAFHCMASGNGDVAFVKDTTIMQVTQTNLSAAAGYTPQDFELLCLDGTRAPFDAADKCNLGTIKSHVVMTSASRDPLTRSEFMDLLMQISEDFGVNGAFKHIFEVFSSYRYGKLNLLFTDDTQELVTVGSQDDIHQWVGPEFIQRIASLNDCPIMEARWCVISMQEMKKCERMIMAFRAKNLKPTLNCILGTSTRDCMEKIQNGDADLKSLDAADLYAAGKLYGLVPIAAEDYSGNNDRKNYAVAIARRTDSRLTIFNLKSRRTCHSAVMSAAGWIIPVDKLIDSEQIRVRDCNIYFYVGQFFSKSCVPGVLQQHYNTKGTNPINLCEACSSGGSDRCKRTPDELYYGNSGAFRCLVERGGDVAFAKHTTVRENTDGRNIAEWARNRRSDDYELLCNDGTRRDIDDWQQCNMGEIPANAIVTADFKSPREREIYWTLLNYAQQFFASDSNPDFHMFSSMLNYKDLIFQDSTVRLIAVPPEEQTYQQYLGPAFLRAMKRMSVIDCITSSSSRSQPLGLLTGIIVTIFVYVTVR